jgi:predicted transposase YdaD
MVILEESPWYHEIIRRGEVRGQATGIAQGRQEEASDMILRQLTRRAGPIAPDLEIQIRSFPREQLETLGDALLDFSGPNDLTAWLNQNT